MYKVTSQGRVLHPLQILLQKAQILHTGKAWCGTHCNHLFKNSIHRPGAYEVFTDLNRILNFRDEEMQAQPSQEAFLSISSMHFQQRKCSPQRVENLFLRGEEHLTLVTQKTQTHRECMKSYTVWWEYEDLMMKGQLGKKLKRLLWEQK